MSGKHENDMLAFLDLQLQERLSILKKEKEQTEIALQESEQFNSSLLKNSPTSILVINPDVSIRYVNPAFIKLTGFSKDELIGVKPPYPWWIKERTEEICHHFKKAMRDGCHQFEQLFQTKTGKQFWVEITFTSVKKNSELKYYLSNWVDITNRKHSEIQLRQAQKMEAIGTLAGGIAHDFNNILGAIVGYAELASMSVSKESKAHRYLNELFKAVDRSTELVKQILGFSHRSEHKKIPIQIHPIIKEAIKLLRSSLPTTIEIHQNIKTDAGVVNADATQIHQIILNLCTNAAHAMNKNGGLLNICLQNTSIDVDNPDLRHFSAIPGDYLLLTVSDTGYGMSPEVLEHIFDPYFTTKKKGEGTGLGLAVVHGIVKHHNGIISVFSKPKKGTEFRIYLPIVQRNAQKEIKIQTPFLNGKERILFVDDERRLASLSKQILERLGYKVVSLTSSVEALELFSKNPNDFDLVITDMTMPQMTGEKLAKKLMDIRPDIPIILCTGYSKNIMKEQAYDMGIQEFFMKPVDVHELSKAIRRLLDADKSL